MIFTVFVFPPIKININNEQHGGEGSVCCQTFFSCSFFPVQQTTSGIGERVKYCSLFGLATNTPDVTNNNTHTNAYPWYLVHFGFQGDECSIR